MNAVLPCQKRLRARKNRIRESHSLKNLSDHKSQSSYDLMKIDVCRRMNDEPSRVIELQCLTMCVHDFSYYLVFATETSEERFAQVC